MIRQKFIRAETKGDRHREKTGGFVKAGFFIFQKMIAKEKNV